LKILEFVAVGVLALLSLTGFLLVGCESGSECEDTVTGNETLNQENVQLQQELESLRSEYEVLSSESEFASRELGELKVTYKSLLEEPLGSDLKNPTWQELKQFLELDETDCQEYITDKFDCEGFTISLRDSAWRRGFRSAYVAIGFGEGNTGHALNAFQTEDKGLVYIDNTEHDAVGYVEVGKIYGTIALDGVKEEFIDTTSEPDEFWESLAYTRYGGNVFDYGYYGTFTQRREFYEQSIDAYNTEVDEYNRAAVAFNQDNNTYSFSQMETWEGKLDSWAKNLEQLSEDLGASKLEPMGIVTSIEVYWN